VFLGYTIKPVVYGSIAAGAERVSRIVALITGLGTAFHTKGWKGRILRTAATKLYRRAFRHAHVVVAQNPEIAELFVAEGLADRAKVTVVRGSGVDVEWFAPLPVPTGPVRFLYAGRLLRDKGLYELAAAARELRLRGLDATFRLVGATDPNPTGISREQVEAWQAEGLLSYGGHVSDVRPELAACSVFVLPSYHEGMPRSVLEAMAVGRAVITCDTIGCRETIMLPAGAQRDEEGILAGDNGFLVPVCAARALARAMERLVRDPELVRRMGARSRTFAEAEFDVRKVNAQMLAAMGIPVNGGKR
jgi:glycosyltransferase involved in cell wall biosynthesis